VIAFELPKRENDVSTTKMSISKHLRATVVRGFLDPRKKNAFLPAAHVSANVSFRAKGHRGP